MFPLVCTLACTSFAILFIVPIFVFFFCILCCFFVFFCLQSLLISFPNSKSISRLSGYQASKPLLLKHLRLNFILSPQLLLFCFFFSRVFGNFVVALPTFLLCLLACTHTLRRQKGCAHANVEKSECISCNSIPCFTLIILLLLLLTYLFCFFCFCFFFFFHLCAFAHWHLHAVSMYTYGIFLPIILEQTPHTKLIGMHTDVASIGDNDQCK